MVYGVYVIRDQRTSFLTPTFDYNDASAMRNFEHALQQKESLMFSHPEDYSLYKIGTYDTDKGVISPQLNKLLVDGNSLFDGNSL
uniref:Nonstructural protein n=3 Tax=unclassified Microvirus TaxID=338099 RepID=A0AAU8B6U0_9VIRU